MCVCKLCECMCVFVVKVSLLKCVLAGKLVNTMSEKGSASDMKNAMEGDVRRSYQVRANLGL